MESEAEQTFCQNCGKNRKKIAPALGDASLERELRHTRLLSLTSKLSQLVFHKIAHLHKYVLNSCP